MHLKLNFLPGTTVVSNQQPDEFLYINFNFFMYSIFLTWPYISDQDENF